MDMRTHTNIPLHSPDHDMAEELTARLRDGREEEVASLFSPHRRTGSARAVVAGRHDSPGLFE